MVESEPGPTSGPMIESEPRASYRSYRGFRVYWRTTRHPDGADQLVCSAPGVAGMWNSEGALTAYIDWVVATRGADR